MMSAVRRGLWSWFFAGFAVAFVGMSLAVTTYPMLPSGRGLFACPLWKYYIVEVRRAMASSGTVGPANGSSTAALATAFEHLACSAVVGAVAATIAWAARQLRGYRQKLV